MRMWHSCLILDGVALQLWRALPIVPACLAVRLFVKYVHQLESVAIRQTWCERIRESICWHSGQRYVINADFTLHWIELAMIATSPPLIHPIKPSLFIYLQPQPPDMHGMSELGAPHIHTHTHTAHTVAKVNCAHTLLLLLFHLRRSRTHTAISIQAVSWLLIFYLIFFFLLSPKSSHFVYSHTHGHALIHTVFSVYSAVVCWQGA